MFQPALLIRLCRPSPCGHAHRRLGDVEALPGSLPMVEVEEFATSRVGA